jgi:hypothetical protein
MGMGRAAARALGAGALERLARASVPSRRLIRVTLFPAGRRPWGGQPGVPGPGAVQEASLVSLGAYFELAASETHEKGKGPALLFGPAEHYGYSDAEALRSDALFADADCVGSSDRIRDALRSSGLAHVVTSRYTPKGESFHLHLPLATPVDFRLTGFSKRAYREKVIFALGVLGEIGGLIAEQGFDTAVGWNQLLPLCYAHTRRPGSAVVPCVWAFDGPKQLDFERLVEAFDFRPSAGRPTPGPRRRAQFSARSANSQCEDAWLSAWLLTDRVLSRTARGLAISCPWRAHHTDCAQGPTSTMVFSGGGFHCLHAHCAGRTARDARAWLLENFSESDELLRRFDSEAGLARLSDDLAPPLVEVERCTVDNAQAVMLRELYEVFERGGLLVVRVPTGAGKTEAIVRVASAYPGSLVIVAPTTALATEIHERCGRRGVRSMRHRGLLSLDQTPSERCAYEGATRAMQEAGLAVGANICRRCDRNASCGAGRPVGKGEVHVGTHALAETLVWNRIRKGESAPLIIDEMPRLFEVVEVTDELLVRAEDALRRGCLGESHPLDTYFARVVRAWLALLRLFRQTASGDAAWAALSESERRVLGVFAGMGPQPFCDSGVHGGVRRNFFEIVRDALGRDYPCQLGPRLDQSRSFSGAPFGGDAREDARAITAVMATFGSRAVPTISAGTVWAAIESSVALAIRASSSIAVVSATPDLDALRAVTNDLRLVDIGVVQSATVTRVVVYAADGSRRKLAAGEGTARLGRWVGDAMERIVAWGGQSVLFGVAKPLIDVVRRAAEHGSHSSVTSLDVIHFGASRGIDKWKDYDAFVSLGDDWPNVGMSRIEANALGVDPAERQRRSVRDELEQFHGRARDPVRSKPALHLHYGAVAPGGWTWGNAQVDRVEFGRPALEVVEAVLVDLRQFVAVCGGVGEAARRLSVAERSLRRYLAGERGVPADVVARLRAALPCDRVAGVPIADGTDVPGEHGVAADDRGAD